MWRWTALQSLLFALAASGCARSVVPLTAPGADFAKSEDEAELLREADTVDTDLRRKGLPLHDPRLQSYLDSVLARVAPPGLGNRAPRVSVLRSTIPQAWTLPNGTIYISSALLATLDNEAQLAFVLGHESAHYVNRHHLQVHRDRDTKAIAAAVANIALLGLPLANGVYLLSVTSFRRENEEEADRAGLESMVAAGYDARQAAEFFDLLASAPEAAATTRGGYAVHAAPQERAATIRKLVASGAVHAGSSPAVGAEGYRPVADSLRRTNVELLLDGKRFLRAQEEAEKALSRNPDEAVFHCYEGEAERGAADDPEFIALETAARQGAALTDEMIAAEAARADARRNAALAHYERCLALDPRQPLGHRGIGLLMFDRGDMARGRSELLRYLELSPRAYDRRYIRRRLGLGEGT